MSTTRRASAQWYGRLQDGSGTASLQSSGAATFPVSWPARAEESRGETSPEELLAAAHATCFAMSLSDALCEAGTPPLRLDTAAEVDFQPGRGITAIRLQVHGEVPGVDTQAFRAAAHAAKDTCPVGQALKGVPVTLTVLT